MRSSFGDRNRLLGSKGKLLVLITIGLIAITECALGAATFVSGLVPDWNQPYRYAPPNGPPGPDVPLLVNQWNDWCAPTSAANLAGHWADVRGVPVADTTAFPGSTMAWATDPSWQDYLADGTVAPLVLPGRPAPQAAPGPFPSPTTDIGWYMDTNLGIPYDAGGGLMGGYFFGDVPHPGTYLKNMHVGLRNFLNSRYSLSGSIYWRTGTRGIAYAGGVDPTGGVAQVHGIEASAFNEVKSQINTNRTLILSFKHWTIMQAGVPDLPSRGPSTNESWYGGRYYTWATSPGTSNAEDEYWNLGTNDTALGHAVTCVGYIPANDQDDPYRLTAQATDWVIVHDNWFNTPRNVIIKYGLLGPPTQFNANWVANTTAVPWPTAAKFVKGLVPDWNQPYRYDTNAQPPAANGGPGPDPNAYAPPPSYDQWNAWCAPTSAANLAGHWADYHGAPVADTTPFDGSTVAWAAGTSWQDYLADGFARPAPAIAPGVPPSPTDIGWYMDTNLGVPYDLPLVGTMGGYLFGNQPHHGTYVKDIDTGLANYLNSLYSSVYTNNASGWWNTGTETKFFASGVDPTGVAAHTLANEFSAFNEVKYEINRNHTLIISFKHWSVAAMGSAIPSDGTNTEAVLGGSFYYFETSPGSSNAEDEEWNMDDGPLNLGHAVTAVGYIPANDVLDPVGGTDWVIVHDNWVSTPRNVIVPFDYANNWVANTTAYPDASFLKIIQIVATPVTAVLTFTGIPGALHDLQWKSDLTLPAWSTAQSGLSFSTGNMLAQDLFAPPEMKRFYRIKASY